MNEAFKAIQEKILLLVTLVIEIALGSLLGFVILFVAHHFEVYANSIDGVAKSPIYYGAVVVEWILLVGDILIVLMFVADSLKKAYKETIGKDGELDAKK